MQCANCRFENMPGVAACGRCGSSLRLATAVMDVQPPRATAFAKRWRRWSLPTQRGWRRFWDTCLTATSRFIHAFGDTPELDMPLPRVLARLVVPGWAHIYCGHRWRGGVFLVLFAACLLPGLLYWGTALGANLLGLAFGIHASATLDLIWQGRYGFLHRMAMSLTSSAVLVVGLYLPVGLVLHCLAAPRVLEFVGQPFEAGDVLLVNRWAYVRTPPQPGDVVCFWRHDSPVFQTERGVNMRVPAGEDIDRILAGPGMKVVWENGTLQLDGLATPWQPLNTAVAPQRWQVTVPKDTYLIYPSIIQGALTPAHRQSLSLVAAKDIQGKAYFRWQPLSRWGRIR